MEVESSTIGDVFDVENVLDEQEKKIERFKAYPPLMLNVLLSIDLTVPCYCQELGNHFTTSGPFGLIASPSLFSIFEVGDP